MRVAIVLFCLFFAGCTGSEALSPPAPAGAGDELWSEVDFSCEVDTDCAVRNVGNCCGYYPACVHRDSPTYPERVRALCESEGLSSVCGFPEIAACRCVAGRCEADDSAGGALD